MAAGGFDVVIGNPPYVEYPKVRSQYVINGYVTEDSNNLYCFCLERLKYICRFKGFSGVIVPIAVGSVTETESTRVACASMYSKLWISHYAIRPAKLFEGVEQRLSILIAQHALESSKWFCTKYHQWFIDERPALFLKLCYQEMPRNEEVPSSPWPKLGSQLEVNILDKISIYKDQPARSRLTSSSQWRLIFHRTPGYWIRMLNFLPYFKSPAGDRSVHHIRELYAISEESLSFIGAIGSSSLYFWWFFSLGNCRNLTRDDVLRFPVPEITYEDNSTINELFQRLMNDYHANSAIKKRAASEYQEFDWVKSKPTVDSIDKFLGKLFHLNDEEIDFVVNYDIKVRAGAKEDLSDD
jgi:hypothetical protein